MFNRCPKCKSKNSLRKGKLVGRKGGLFQGNLSLSLFSYEVYRYECNRCGYVRIAR